MPFTICHLYLKNTYELYIKNRHGEDMKRQAMEGEKIFAKLFLEHIDNFSTGSNYNNNLEHVL